MGKIFLGTLWASFVESVVLSLEGPLSEVPLIIIMYNLSTVQTAPLISKLVFTELLTNEPMVTNIFVDLRTCMKINLGI